MKEKLWRWGGFAAVLVLLVFFALIFVAYSQPMEDRIIDLSLDVADGGMSLDVSAERGWTVFVQTGDEVKVLPSNGMGCFVGLEFPGQTFYYARVMTEELDAATLLIGTADRNFAVFLDGELIYTDCPEQDNRIGYLSLPMHVWDRTADLTVALPEGYVGKTLTIAQSSPTETETPSMATRVFPSPIQLVCGYAYESTLIAESFQTAILGASGYALGAAILMIFVIGLLRAKGDASLPFLALAVLLSMSARLYDASYAIKYFGIPFHYSTTYMFDQLSCVALMAFLSGRSGKHCWLVRGLTGLAAAAWFSFFLWGGRFALSGPLMSFLLWTLPELLTFAGLTVLLALSWLQRKESRFHRIFAPATSAILGVYLLVQLLLPSRGAFYAELLSSLRTLTLDTLSCRLCWMMMSVAIVIVIVQFVRSELDHYAEKRLMMERGEMMRQSYENLRLHNDEIMMMRHDMEKHFRYLRNITPDEKTAQYLDTLIGQSEKIRPVMQSGHEMLDVIVGSHAAIAAASGIDMQITRAEAPASLPLSDADLCSLIMNLLDNAIAAARVSGAEKRYVRLDLHIKNDFFVFVCENSARASASSEDKKETVPKHGLGLKIVSQIVERYANLIQTEQGEDFYRVHLAIQLPQSSK